MPIKDAQIMINITVNMFAARLEIGSSHSRPGIILHPVGYATPFAHCVPATPVLIVLKATPARLTAKLSTMIKVYVSHSYLLLNVASVILLLILQR